MREAGGIRRDDIDGRHPVACGDDARRLTRPARIRPDQRPLREGRFQREQEDQPGDAQAMQESADAAASPCLKSYHRHSPTHGARPRGGANLQNDIERLAANIPFRPTAVPEECATMRE